MEFSKYDRRSHKFHQKKTHGRTQTFEPFSGAGSTCERVCTKVVLDYPGYKAQGSSPFSQRYSTMLTWRLIFRQVEKFLHLNTRLIFTRLQLIGNQHWKVGYKPQDLGSRLLHRAARRTLEKEGCISSCGKPGSSTLPTNMTNVVIVKEGWLHKRGTNSSTRSFLKNSSQPHCHGPAVWRINRSKWNATTNLKTAIF